MKIRNIVFSGFMASILMAGVASADPVSIPTLATKGYVDGAYKAAVVNTDSPLQVHIGDTEKHITAAERTKWDGAVSDLAAEVVRAKQAEEANAAAIVENKDDIAANTSAILENKDDIATNKAAIEAIAGALGDVDATKIANLTARVATAEAEIASNTTAIDANTAAIADNKDKIAANAAAITTEKNRATNAEAGLGERIDGLADTVTTLAGCEGLCYVGPNGTVVPVQTTGDNYPETTPGV